MIISMKTRLVILTWSFIVIKNTIYVHGMEDMEDMEVAMVS